MAESVYKVIELVGTSTDSWEKAAAAAVGRAGESLRDLRVARRNDVAGLAAPPPDPEARAIPAK